jgi:putative FmdB family regulatory protein
MPIYEFKCDQCAHQFEQIVLSADEPAPECPQCSGKDVSKLISAGSFRPHGIPTGSGGFTPPACKTSGGGGG